MEFSGGRISAVQVTRTVTVIDNLIPVITLVGGAVDLFLNDAYVEQGATASDNIDGDLTDSIIIDSSAVDNTTPGSYSVTYNVSDAAGNAASQVTRTVTVIDNVIPVITLVGGAVVLFNNDE